MRNRYSALTIAVATGLGLASGAQANVTFNTFVPGSAISAAEGGNHSTIAFTYTGTGFVGTVYFGTDNNQLYSTNLSGGNVTQYGGAIPGFSGEVVVGSGLGQGGFASGAVYAGNGQGSQIYSVPSSGAPVLFAALPDGGNVRQIFFDPGNTYGGDMLVTSNQGNVYKINSAGSVSLLASIGADTEGMDIASSAFGTYANDLLVASEGTGLIHAITPGGSVGVLPGSFTLAETVSTVPTDLCSSNNPLQGFYVANYAVDIQKADYSQFCAYQGDTIVTGELGTNSPVTDI